MTIRLKEILAMSATPQIRRYARSLHRINSGIWCCNDVEKFQSITLTTKLGDDNTFKRLSKDIKELMRRVRKLGVELEYVFARATTPINGLVHAHGLLRVDKGEIKAFDVGKLWQDIHGAWQVDVKRLYSFGVLEKYVAKHMLHEMPDLPERLNSPRLMISKGWMPKKSLEVHKMLAKNAMEALRYLPEPWRYAKAMWWKVNELYRGYCEGKRILFRSQGVWVTAYQGEIMMLK